MAMLRDVRPTVDASKTSKILMVYTGGTIGMRKGPNGKYEPVTGYLEERIKCFPSLYDPDFKPPPGPSDMPSYATPVTNEGVRIIYNINEMDPIIDSSNINEKDWTKIGQVVESNYNDFDGFVIIHGTDTMAYTASALSFMLENLGKPVIVTGSQIPLCEQRNDGVDNLVGSLIFASSYNIPEVCLYFDNKLLRGNRSVKQNNEEIDAFSSPNMEPLATMGTHILVNWAKVRKPQGAFKVKKYVDMCSEIVMLRFFPGMTASTLDAFLAEPVRGAVLLSYGAGNGPANIIPSIKRACDRGVIVVNVSQCLSGTVSEDYETGEALLQAGALPGADMTAEAAMGKLSFLLAQGNDLTAAQQKACMVKNMRGEMAVSSCEH